MARPAACICLSRERKIVWERGASYTTPLGEASFLAAQELVPSSSDTRPGELPAPFGPRCGQLAAFVGICQQLGGRIDPASLRFRILDAVGKTVAILPGVVGLARDFYAELHAFRQCADVGRDRNATAGLRLPD